MRLSSRAATLCPYRRVACALLFVTGNAERSVPIEPALTSAFGYRDHVVRIPKRAPMHVDVEGSQAIEDENVLGTRSSMVEGPGRRRADC